MDPQPRLLSKVRCKSWHQRSALPALAISACAKCLCFPALVLLPLVALYLMRQMFAIGSGAMQDLSGQLLPLHSTLPLSYTLLQQLKSLWHPPARLP